MDTNTTLLMGFALVVAVFLYGLWYDRKNKRNGNHS